MSSHLLWRNSAIYGKDSIVSTDMRNEFKNFDATDNWLEQVSYDKGKLKTITERTIEYY